MKGLEIDYTDKQVFNILLELYSKDTALFEQSGINETIENILNNNDYTKDAFYILLKQFILDLKECLKSKESNNWEKYYELVKIYINIDYNSIYKKFKKIKSPEIVNAVLDIYIISEQILKIQEFTFDEKNQELAHYTSKAGAMAILGKGSKIRLKNTIYANDPQEGEFLKNLVIRENNIKEQDIKDEDNRIIINLDKYKNNNVYFTCFSTNIDEDDALPMWVHYADKAEGCILVFGKEFLGSNNVISSEIKTDLSVAKLYNVFYLEEEEIKNINENNKYEEDTKRNEVINLVIDLKQKIIELENNDKSLEIVEEMLEYVSFIFKRSHFKYEKEVRLLKRVEENSYQKIKVDNKIVPELYVEFEKDIKCKYVILGSKCTDIDSIARFLAYRNISECKISKLSYR